jgi:DNA-binding transcriptional regulator YdaS (Cro superfamily)
MAPESMGSRLLRQWRGTRTQFEVAQQLGLRDSTRLSKWETGKTRPNRRAAAAIERATEGLVTVESWDIAAGVANEAA